MTLQPRTSCPDKGGQGVRKSGRTTRTFRSGVRRPEQPGAGVTLCATSLRIDARRRRSGIAPVFLPASCVNARRIKAGASSLCQGFMCRACSLLDKAGATLAKSGGRGNRPGGLCSPNLHGTRASYAGNGAGLDTVRWTAKPRHTRSPIDARATTEAAIAGRRYRGLAARVVPALSVSKYHHAYFGTRASQRLDVSTRQSPTMPPGLGTSPRLTRQGTAPVLDSRFCYIGSESDTHG